MAGWKAYESIPEWFGYQTFCFTIGTGFTFSRFLFIPLFQRGWEVWRNVSDKCGRQRWRELSLRSSWTFQVNLHHRYNPLFIFPCIEKCFFPRYNLVPVWRPEVRPQVRQLDLFSFGGGWALVANRVELPNCWVWSEFYTESFMRSFGEHLLQTELNGLIAEFG